MLAIFPLGQLGRSRFGSPVILKKLTLKSRDSGFCKNGMSSQLQNRNRHINIATRRI